MRVISQTLELSYAYSQTLELIQILTEKGQRRQPTGMLGPSVLSCKWETVLIPGPTFTSSFSYFSTKNETGINYDWDKF